MNCCGGMDGGMWWVWGLLWFALIAAGIVLVVWAITRGSGGKAALAHGSDRALVTLRERFASGEINEAEYQQRRSVLDEKAPDQ